MTFDGESPMAHCARPNGREKPWKVKLLRRRQRELGLRRQHAAGILRRRVPPLSDVCPQLRRQQDLPDRLRRERRRLSMDGSADARGRRRRWTGCRCTTTRCRALGGRRARRPISTEGRLVRDAAQGAASWTSSITKHSTIMDKYDPEKRIGLIVDEWGTWYDVEPGTNPGFLYQQNTMRDALVARRRCISSTSTATASGWRTSRRPSTCCRP